MSDNEEAVASLGDAEVLRVKAPKDPPIPALPQRPEDGSKIPPAVGRQKAADVLENHPAGTQLASDAKELPEQPASLSTQARTASSHAEVLAGEAAAEEVNGSERCAADFAHISVTLHVRPVEGEDRAGVRV
jgi:hypothetical protein